MKKKSRATPVAVVGMSAIYPGGSGLAAYWRTIASGRDAIGDIPASHWLIDDYFDPNPNATDKTYCRRGGFIDPIPFDPVQFGLPPNVLPATDTAQLLALMAAKEALEAARRGSGSIDSDRISVILGVASTTELVVHMGARLQRPVWRKALIENGASLEHAELICDDIAAHYAPWQESTFPGLLGNVVAGRIANRLNIGGSNFVTDAACASSLAAVGAALNELYLDEADLVLTGGVDALNDIMMFMCFSKTPAFSPTGDCRPFSDAADGTIIGEGVGIVALKRLEDAERDGDVIHAVIRGIGASSDGRAASVYAPRPEGQAKALRRTYERAGYAPATVGLVEAHGTATKAGDVAEFAGLSAVFDKNAGQRCALGSVKSQIGHTKAAAGAAGLIKTVLALQHQTLPGTAKVARPNPALKLDQTPFYVNSVTRPWVHAAEHPRRAAVSSFGFGGSNFHLTLEEYRGAGRARRMRVLPTELVLLSAPTVRHLAARCGSVIEQIAGGESLARLAFEAPQAFSSSHAVRAGVVASDTQDLRRLLDIVRAAAEKDALAAINNADIAIGLGPPRAGQTAFLFPGQGSQYVGMCADLAMAFPEALDVWTAFEASLAGLSSTVFPEPAFDAQGREAQQARLTEMTNAQPALAGASLSQLALLDRLGIRPDMAGGHSFGELTALAAAGVLPREKLPEIARTRGALMAEAAGARRGAMLAIAADAAAVQSMLAGDATLADAVVIANDNAPGQVVIAGLEEAITRAHNLAKKSGLTTHRLPVASAFHSFVVEGSCAPFQTYLQGIETGAPHFPVFANVTAKPYADEVAASLAAQLRSCVRFREMILEMARAGATRFIEVGPGRVLTGLVGQILGAEPHLAVALDDRKFGDLRAWHRGLATLAADGVALNLEALFATYDAPTAHVAPPAHAVMVGGANLGKPYPPADGKVELRGRSNRLSRTASEAMEEAATFVAPPPAAPQTLGLVEAAVAAPARASPAGADTASGDVWALIDRIQEETAAQHRQYLETMAQSHQSFLDMTARSIAAVAGGAALESPVPAQAPVVTQIAAAPAAAAPPRPLVHVPASPIAAPVAAPAVAVESAETIVLRIVAEKTGYPASMLGLDMELEAELGIDSIKQVEILSALQDQTGTDRDIAADAASSMRTLRDIAEAVAPMLATAAPIMPAHARATAAMAPGIAALAASDLVLSIVAEKTGYPADMLGLDMELEAELGIDSIKQVEILSALQERAPGLGDIASDRASAIRTLRDIVEAVDGVTTTAAPEGATRVEPTLAKAEEVSTVLRSWVRTFVAKPATGLALSGLMVQRVHVTREDAAFADDIVSCLQNQGVDAVAVDTLPDDASAVVSLAALASSTTMDAVMDSAWSQIALAQTVARSGGATRLFVGVRDADKGETHAVHPLSGIVRTLSHEWPNGSLKIIEMENRDAERLVDELMNGGGEIEVRLAADGARLVAEDAPLELGAGSDGEIFDGVVVVSGGARGVTASCALALARKHGLRLALFGRTPMDAAPDIAANAAEAEVATALVEMARKKGTKLGLAQARQKAARLIGQRDMHATLKAAAAAGIVARYYAVDVTDAEAVRTAVQRVRDDMGPIVGLVHGAGVLADRKVADIDREKFARVFATKVSGGESLLAATRGDELKFVALFSSVAGHTGNAGQSAYAAANETLDRMARREAAARGPSCVVRAYGWGPWDGGMVDADLKARFAAANVRLIPLGEGADFFAETITRAGGASSFVVGPPPLSASDRLASAEPDGGESHTPGAAALAAR